jgi:ketosteroid isomerase-like protein
MDDPDVDALQRFYAAWTDGDLPRMLAEVHPDVEAQPVFGLLYERPSYRGHGGIAQWFEETVDLWDGLEFVVESAHEVDAGVVAFLHLIARSGDRSSDARLAAVCRFRDGRIVSVRGRDQEEVAEELGLAP